MTVIRATDAVCESRDEAQRAAEGAMDTLRLSDAGGLTQLGAYLVTLAPGARSSDRHWHEQEDEWLYLLTGEATVVENDGAHVIGPGDTCCWKAGDANGHSVENRSDAPCTFIIVGTRPEHDVCHYPDLGRTLYTEGRDWRLVDDASGTVLKHGRIT